MTPRHRIPTRRVFPRALTVIGLAILAVASALLLTGCAKEVASTESKPSKALILLVWRDVETGCDYVSTADWHGMTPRLGRDGKQICK